MKKLLLFVLSITSFSLTNLQALTYTVTNTNDAGAGSLRAQIATANGTAAADVIEFGLGAAPGVIALTSGTIIISDPGGLYINGYENGAADGGMNFNDLVVGSYAAAINIRITSTAATAISITSDFNTITGIAFYDCGDGTVSPNDIIIDIQSPGGNNNTIIGCHIGMTPLYVRGTKTYCGIRISGNDNIIGDGTANGNNYIAGMRNGAAAADTTSKCIYINGGSRNVISGNLIAADESQLDIVNGATAFQPSTMTAYGIYIDGAGATNNTIGSSSGYTTGGSNFNFIGGNGIAGIFITGAGTGNVIEGNYIGPNRFATTAVLPNSCQKYGIYILNTASVTIGAPLAIGAATADNYRNLISGNLQSAFVGGVLTWGGYGIYLAGTSTGTIIRRNYIGPNAAGTGTVATADPYYQGYGIYSEDGPSFTISENLISGNDSHGIYTEATLASTIKGNTIGLTSALAIFALATQPQANGIYAVNATNLTIGGTGATEGNTLSGNYNSGISLTGGSNNNTIIHNIIGTAAGRTTAFGADNDQYYGIYVSGPDNTIGGTTFNRRNVISDNVNMGIQIDNGGSGTIIKGNFIGLAPNGVQVISSSSQDHGILINSGTDNIIGGTTAAERNIISGNTGGGVGDYGIRITGGQSADNFVRGNYIGTDSLGTTALGLQDYGIIIHSSVVIANTVGGTAANQGNLISGNDLGGIQLEGSNQIIHGNIIGPRAAGLLTVGSNGQDYGIIMDTPFEGPHFNTIGGTTAAACNYISGNLTAGIYMTATWDNCGQNTIQGNRIGPDAAATPAALASNPQDYGIYIDNAFHDSTIIGGNKAAAGNIIAFNTQDGVYIPVASLYNKISRNLIYGNGSKAINLVGGGNGIPTPPQIASFTTISVTGTAAAANANDTIEIFATKTTGLCQDAYIFLAATKATAGGAWGPVTIPTISGSGTKIVATARTQASGFLNTSELGCSSAVLPIELLSFEAVPVNNQKVKLNWSTATEINNDYFTVERSANGVEFSPVLTKNAVGNSTVVQNYEDFDAAPMLGTSYYRLKQTDFDGNYTYSQAVPVTFGTDGSENLYFLLTNPITSNQNAQLSIHPAVSGEISLVVYDAVGRLIFSKVTAVTKGVKQVVDLETQLAAGMYHIRATADGDQRNFKLIVE